MAIVADKEAKAERIEVRVTPNAKALLTAAAQAVIMPRVFYASEQGWAAIQKILDENHQQQPGLFNALRLS